MPADTQHTHEESGAALDYVKRIPKDVFEKWYRSQNKFQKLDRVPTAEELGSEYILVCDAAELLGISYDELVSIRAHLRRGS